MYLKKPDFWDRKDSLLAYLLVPFTIITILYNFLRFKRKIYISKKIKTICIGNIYLGGTGKTPTTIKLYDLLKKNKKVVTAKKYYPNHRDEEILLKRKSNFVTAKNRKEIIEKAIKKKIDLVLFDDGLQDCQINYDIKLVCFDADNGIGNGLLIPAGPLRENLNILKNYDAILIKKYKKNANFLVKLFKKYNSKIKIFFTEYRITNLNIIDKSKKFLIFSGIGNPKNFESILIKNNIKIIERIIFPDHYFYSAKDLKNIINKAKKLNVNILTTEKDFTKIPKKFKKYIKFIKIDLIIKKEKNFLKFIKYKLND